MGFFSSKKQEETDHQSPITPTPSLGAHPTPTTSGDKSVVQVIRSRFYGKHKGKEREQAQGTSYATPSSVSAAHTLSNASSTPPHAPVASSPLKRQAQAGPSILRTPSTLRGNTTTTTSPLPDPPPHDHSAPSTPAKKHAKLPMLPPPVPPHSASSLRIRTTDSQHSRSQPASPARGGDSPSTANASPASPRKPTDTVTVTLAQRLNELAVANSEGLLNDDEYRLLRQSLFERFSSTAVVPTESPVVPAARPRVRNGGPLSESRPNTMRPMSNFQVEVPRPSSVHSRSSVRSGMTDLFRRATGRRGGGSNDFSETSSIWSGTSTTSNFFRLPKVLSKKSSTSSIRTNASRTQQQQVDTISVSSRRTGVGERGTDHLSVYAPSVGTRSAAGSLRRAAPPSSFRAVPPPDGSHKYAQSVNGAYEDETPATAQAIRQEILAVEAEARRLMDAFNGLELTTLAKSQRHHVQQGRLLPRTLDATKSVYSYVESSTDGRSQRRVPIGVGGDGDGVSIRSGASVGTRSVYSARRGVRQKTSVNASLALSAGGSRPGSLHRKNSLSSVTSDKRGRPLSMAPPVPALPASLGGHHVNGSTASLVRSTGHLPINTIPEDGVGDGVSLYGQSEVEEVGAGDVEAEMEDIQRRREEVRQRYEVKLEYLRAKLKGAQLHEKLLRK